MVRPATGLNCIDGESVFEIESNGYQLASLTHLMGVMILQHSNSQLDIAYQSY